LRKTEIVEKNRFRYCRPLLLQQPSINTNKILHDSVLAGNVSFVSLLLEHGADFRIQNNEGQTVLDVAKKQRQEDPSKIPTEIWNEIIQLLRYRCCKYCKRSVVVQVLF
jgi:ankyrin repeat protein